MTSIRIPVYRPSLAGREKEYVADCLDSTWISSKGKYIALFEERFAAATGVRHAATVANGTVALHSALAAIGVGPGDEVIVPSLTYIASVNAVAYTGATPVFADSLEGTWQLDPEDVRSRATPRTKAVMAVHLYGHPCDMDALGAVARERGLLVVEDCAEAFGSRWRGAHVGGFGAIATYSFFGNKTITTGEGGMVVTNDRALHEKVIRLKGQGLAEGREYWHDIVGYNYRMTNVCAAIGCAQLERAGELIAKKRRIAAWYAEGLAGLPLDVHRESEGTFHSWWMCSALLDDPALRDPLRARLMEEGGVETRPFFYPVHTMPMYAGAAPLRLPVAESLAARGINLPSWPGLEREQVDGTCAIVRRFFGGR